MNKLIIIGNLTRDPESRTLASGNTACNFTVAVNRKRSRNNDHPDADYFRVAAWNKLGEVCQRYLAKGRKVCVTGNVSVSSYEAKDGGTRFSLGVYAEDVEFLTPRDQRSDADGSGYDDGRHDQYSPATSGPAEYNPADLDDDDLPF